MSLPRVSPLPCLSPDPTPDPTPENSPVLTPNPSPKPSPSPSLAPSSVQSNKPASFLHQHYRMRKITIETTFATT